MLEFNIHHRELVVQILSIHLQNMQCVVFRDKDKLDSVIVNTHSKKTTLIEWLHYNEWNTDGRHLTYLDFPTEFVWNPSGKYWSRHGQSHRSSIGRLTYVHPASGDLFYQRMLLCHQKGCRSFPEIRKVNDIVHPTCRAACQALGLLEDDQEWENTIKEASCTATPAELRTLLLMEEKSYNRELLAREKERLIGKLNEKQRHIFKVGSGKHLALVSAKFVEASSRGGVLYVRGMAYEVELGKYLAMVFSGLGVLVMIAERRSFWVARFLMATLSLDCDAASFSLFTVMVSTSFERFLAMAAKDSNTEGGYCFGGIDLSGIQVGNTGAVTVKVKGCRSFPEIRKVNDIVHPTCRAACQALGLLEDDQEWENTIKEASCTATPAELRTLFAHILTFCQVTDPSKL
ncbi:hypothetical protein Tco_1249717 [Tanacetum coccineum]